MRELLGRGVAVRAVVRDAARGAALSELGAEVVVADLREARFVDCDLTGARIVDGCLVDVDISGWVSNLVVNGIDAIADMPNGVREIACRSWTSDGLAHISIRDTGPGIPLDRLERLFEPFFTTKQEGMGMGLCIAHAIIESHGGKIPAESQSNGAVFHVSLPSLRPNGQNME